MNRLKIFAAIPIAATLLMAAPAIAAACATCGLGGDDPGTHAYTMSAIFLISGPYLVGATIGGIIYAAWRRSARREKVQSAISIVKP